MSGKPTSGTSRLIGRYAAWIGAGAIALMAAAWSAGAPVAAQAPADAQMRIWTGVYTAEQATRGKATYASNCVNCHNGDLSGSRSGPQLSGAAFMEKWELQTVDRLYRTIRETMPRNNPGSLTDQAATDLVALVLQSNGFPAGAEDLRATAPVLEALTIVPKGGPTRKEIANFTLVQTVGCLVADGDNRWTLTASTDPLGAKDAPASEAELKEAAGARPGLATLRLVSVLPFKPDAHQRQRVLVKGLLNRYPGEMPLLNVTVLQSVAPTCG
jgi:mono/diheme cytochrome c family protein